MTNGYARTRPDRRTSAPGHRSSRIRRTRRLITLVLALCLANVFTATPASADTREITVFLTNNSDSALSFASHTLDHGCWSTEPPAKIAIGQTVIISSVSCGFATGTEFHASYWVDRTGTQLSLHYNNPFAGSDDFAETAPQGYAVEAFGVIEQRTVRFGCDSKTCDGIPDEWKTNGVTIDPGGGDPSQFVDLPKMGVSLDRPNILVQLDWMDDGTPGHNQQLTQAAMDTVINAFDQNPVTYRGATRPGVTLRIDAGPTSTITPGGATWGPLSRAQQVTWAQDFLTGSPTAGYQLANFYSLLKSNFVPTGRLPIFHYSVAAAEISATGTSANCYKGDSTSGLTPGDKLGFMVTLGDWTGCVGSQNEQTGTFMHEFGHVLGLDHSGGEGDGDTVNRKPNYPSVMSYAYQTVGVFRGGAQAFDYSRDTMPAVDETKLTESGGVNLGNNPSGYGTTNSCGAKDGDGKLDITTTFVQAGLSPVDWNCDTTTPNGATGFDGNGDTDQGILKGSTSDWSRIEFKTGGVGAGSNAKDTVTIPSSGVSAPHQDVTYEQSRQIRVLPLATTLTYNGASEGDYHDAATMSAALVDPGDADSPIEGKTITFQIGASATDVCSATTNASGTASCAITPTQASGLNAVTASFGGDAIYKPASDSNLFTITTEESTLTFSGPTVILAGSTTSTLSALLVEDGANDDDGDGGARVPSPSGQTVTFTLGGQSCSGTTDATGLASCSIPGVSGATLGPKALTATFAGDRYYRPSSDSDEVIVFAFPSKGAFVLGDSTVATATPTTSVTWWSDIWWLQNTVSGGFAPDSFKGFAAGVSTLPTATPANSCGTKFVTRAGNSPPPTTEVPSYMGVIVADSVTKSGPAVNGAWGKIVVVKTDPGYAPDAGHPGTGEIVATFCS